MFTNDTIDRLIGADVIDSTGDKVGSIGQVFLDDQTNQPTWVTVNTGFFGMKETFIPLQGANFEGDALRVGYEKGFIKDAPNVDVDNGHLSPEEEAELYRYYSIDDGVAADRTVADTADADRDADLRREGVVNDGVATDRLDDDVTATAREERLNVGTEQVEGGRVRLRKYTTTEHQQVSVPVEKERLVVEREAGSGQPVDGGLDANRADDIDETITLREERPVVSKETVEGERVHVGKETVTENQVVEGDVTREHIEVEGAEGVDGTRAGDAEGTHERSLRDLDGDGHRDTLRPGDDR